MRADRDLERQGRNVGAGVQRIFGKDGFDVAFECVGVEPTLTAAVETIQKGGTLIVVGVFGEKPRIDMGLVQDRELNIRGTLMYQAQDYKRAVSHRFRRCHRRAVDVQALPVRGVPGRLPLH